VLDASRVLAGPFCGQILADLGAEVVKIERPGQGDETRGWGPPFAGPLSAYFLSCNRGKKAITLDLSRAEGRTLFHQLAKSADVVLENMLPPAARKLGLDPETLHAHNPRLILCSISGFGRTGPMSELPGYDLAVQAMSGMMSITGPVEGPPCKVGVAVADVLTGVYSATAILACLHARHASGHGYAIDMALLDCILAAQVNVAQAYLTSGKVPPRHGNAHLQIVPYQAFQTADDWLVLAVGNDGQWQRFCVAAERPDLARDERFLTNRQRVELRTTIVPLLEELLKTRSAADWQRRLLDAGVPHAPVWNYAQIFAQEQVAAREMKITVRDPQGRPVDLVGSPFHVSGAARPEPVVPPTLGQDTDAFLRQALGLSAETIAEYRAAGIV
jgi:crotonobetainyl-CoA:carnitine CoA-transferase CaiB-like acyl-CoA transferase